MRRFFLWCDALCAAFFFTSVSAQIPDAADLDETQRLRQQERAAQLRQQLESKPDVRLPPLVATRALRLPLAESPCFVIHRISLVGEMSERFSEITDSADYAADGRHDAIFNRCIGVISIGVVIRRIQNELVRRGFVTTRVLAGPQELSKGVLTLTLVPGRVRAIRFAEGTATRATIMNATPLRTGDLLNLRAIEQTLENLKRVPTTEADIRIEPVDTKGAQPGDSDMVIQWRQRFPFRVNLYTDNSGLDSTGRYQGGLTLSYDHALTLNDLFYVSFNRNLFDQAPGPRGTNSNTVHYSLPFGYWLLSATAGNSQYRQAVAGVNSTTIFSGESTNQELKLSRILARDANSKTIAYLSAWAKQARNFVGDLEIAVQRRQLGGFEAGFTHRQVLRSATLDVNAGYRHGSDVFGHHPLLNESVEGSTRPQILQVGALYNQPFAIAAQRFRYTLAMRAQYPWTSLLPQDRFSIGSRFSVRGFDEQRMLSADRGWLVRNDLGVSLGRSGQEVYLGLDYGEVSGRHSEQLAGKHLAGLAFGLRGGAQGVAYDVFAGRALSAPVGFSTQGLNVGFSLSWSY
ncbi:MAG: ShlB/FhaC/HecB family hemolysin secretion/activation protein [Oxalobacteraceae bacterium]|nr:ShlB/FhaC/HecB family hemolysin secretion/activation protein [Oxalobacteraceae bacterium]